MPLHIENKNKSVSAEVQTRQMAHFLKADADYGQGVDAGLGIELVADSLKIRAAVKIHCLYGS